MVGHAPEAPGRDLRPLSIGRLRTQNPAWQRNRGRPTHCSSGQIGSLIGRLFQKTNFVLVGDNRYRRCRAGAGVDPNFLGHGAPPAIKHKTLPSMDLRRTITTRLRPGMGAIVPLVGGLRANANLLL